MVILQNITSIVIENYNSDMNNTQNYIKNGTSDITEYLLGVILALQHR